MRIKDIPRGDIFTIEDVTAYPKLKLQEGYVDIRDGVHNPNNLKNEVTIMTLEETATVLDTTPEELEEILVAYEREYNPKEEEYVLIEEPLFTPKQLKALKQRVQKDINIELRITNAIYEGIGGTDLDLYPYTDHLEKVAQGSHRFKKGKELDLSLVTQPDYKIIDQKLRFTGNTTSIGRYDEFASLDVYYYGYIPKSYTEAQLNSLIQVRTKAELTLLVMPEGYDIYTFTLDCKLMELFKEGSLTMEEVVNRSKGDCKL